MNFQYIPPVPSAKTLLDLAFARARERSEQRGKPGEPVVRYRRKEGIKFDIVKDTLITRLSGVLDDFPKEAELPSFYQRLLKLTMDYPLYKQSFGALHWAIGKIRLFHKEYILKLNHSEEVSQLLFHSRQFYGRVSSLLKQIEQNLRYLESARRILRTYPDIKEMFTVCVYGFPNVGKSTLLNKLTGAKAEVASYAFTTKSINAGYIKVIDATAPEPRHIQVLDVPGTLARKDKMNVIEMQAELVVKELAQVVIFVFDLSGYSGYSLKKQEQLYKNIKSQKKVLIYLSKQDLSEEEVLKEFPYAHYTVQELRAEIEKQAIATAREAVDYGTVQENCNQPSELGEPSQATFIK